MSAARQELSYSAIALYVIVAGALGAAAGMAAIVSALAMELSPKSMLLAPLAAVAVTGGLLVFAHTWWGLCFAAFAICPLGILQIEVAGVTVGLPEILILGLFVKEAAVFFLQGERPARAVPWKTLIAYVAASLVGLATALLRGNGLVAALQDWRQFTEFIALYLLVVHRVTDRRRIKILLAAFMLGGTLLAIHGILERFTNFGIPLNQLLSDAVFHGAVRSGSFYGATPLGGLLVLSIGAQAGLILSTRLRSVRLGVGLCLCLCLAAIVFTNTRASWVALFFAFLFIFLSIRKTLPVLLAVTIGFVVFSATLGPIVVKRLAKLEFTKAERSLLERVNYYTVAWHIFRGQPVFGLGWGCYYTVSDVLLNKAYVPRPRPEDVEGAFHVDESTVHSAYLQLLVKTGLVGLLSFLAIILAWLRTVWRESQLEKRNEADHNLYVCVCAGVLGYLLHSAFENFFQWPVMAQSFWLLFGLSTVMGYTLIRRGTLAPAEE